MNKLWCFYSYKIRDKCMNIYKTINTIRCDGATCNGEYLLHETYTYVHTNMYVQNAFTP